MDNIHVVKETTLTVKKKSLVLVLPYLGSIFLQTRTKLKKSLKNIFNCFFYHFFLYGLICKTKHKVETQKYIININLYREITSTKMKHCNLLVSIILLFITNEGTNE